MIRTAVLAGLGAVAMLGGEGRAQYRAEPFTFTHDGLSYTGYIDRPEDQPAKGLIVLIPGHGPTEVTQGHELRSTRERLNAWGWATALWDRAGNGLSEGEYDHDQPVQDSAREAAAALDALRQMDAPGVDTVGFWGASRGGWIAPLAIVEDGDVDFWISVSGPDGLETFGYMLRRNVELDGRTPEQARRVSDAWAESQRLLNQPGTTYEAYLDTVEPLHDDPWFSTLDGSGPPTREEFDATHRERLADPMEIDPETGMPVMVRNFDRVLNALDMPVLAIWGDKDSQLDWRAARALYEATLGTDHQSDLTVRVLENCNHSMRVVETGAYREDLSAESLGQRCPGYTDAMRVFLEAVAATAD